MHDRGSIQALRRRRVERALHLFVRVAEAQHVPQEVQQHKHALRLRADDFGKLLGKAQHGVHHRVVCVFGQRLHLAPCVAHLPNGRHKGAELVVVHNQHIKRKLTALGVNLGELHACMLPHAHGGAQLGRQHWTGRRLGRQGKAHTPARPQTCPLRVQRALLERKGRQPAQLLAHKVLRTPSDEHGIVVHKQGANVLHARLINGDPIVANGPLWELGRNVIAQKFLEKQRHAKREACKQFIRRFSKFLAVSVATLPKKLNCCAQLLFSHWIVAHIKFDFKQFRHIHWSRKQER
mmetsp:Transcript_15510/g.39606  ORF Transcript_15510/g.39606 Transcript_15510/m.39606 type:complete len:293 (+) Transcript_15510:304-1182(+)